MTTDSTPSEQTPIQTPDGQGGKQKRPVVWMVLAGMAIIAAIGLGAWALLLNDDLNDTEAQLEAQTAAAESASAEAERRIADARASIDAALSGNRGRPLGTIQEVLGTCVVGSRGEHAGKGQQHTLPFGVDVVCCRRDLEGIGAE